MIPHTVQITVNIIFFNIYACYGSDELGLYTYDIISNFKFWFSFFLILVIALIPVIISKKVEFFLSHNIVDNLRNRNFEDDYTRKICIKKIEQVHKCSRSLAKFRKIYKANKNNNTLNIQNLADKKMKEIVDQYNYSKKIRKLKFILDFNDENKEALNANNYKENLKLPENKEIQNFKSLNEMNDVIIQRAKTSKINNEKVIQLFINNTTNNNLI